MEGRGNIFDNETHPLLTDVILNVLFEHLKVDELKKCRLVCAIWNSSVLASLSWKRRIEVEMIPDPEKGRTVENFLNLVKNRVGPCISETYATYYEQPPWVYEVSISPISQAFWSRCGTWIKILKLQDVKFELVDDFRRVIYKACQNMEQLSLGYITVTRGENEEDELEPTNYLEPQFGEHNKMRVLAVSDKYYEIYGVSWMDLFSHFPNLKALCLECRIRNMSGLITSFNKVRDMFPNKLKLKYIICNHPDPEFFSILKDSRLKLQTIETDAFLNTDDFRQILTIHASSLKKLGLSSSTYTQDIDPNKLFPLQSSKFRSIGLDALQVLEMNNEVFMSMTVLKFTPNLRILEIWTSGDSIIENTQISEMENVSLKKCKQLTFVTPQLSLDSLSKLISWIPNVEEVNLHKLTNAHFQMICEGWPGLFTFNGYGEVDDLGITGLDKEDVHRINEQEESSSWRPITVPRANITGLKDLRNLYMCGERTTEIGYCAAVCGVELLPKLETFHFEDYDLKGQIWDSFYSRFPKANPCLYMVEDYSSLWEYRFQIS